MEYESMEKEREIDLLEYWKTIVKRKWVIVGFAAILMLSVGIITFNIVPKYKAMTTLLIKEEGSKMLSIEDEFGYQRRVVNLRFYNTQLKLLKSKSLVERVVRLFFGF